MNCPTRGLCAFLLAFLAASGQAQLLDFRSGHIKGQYLLGSYPDDSVLRDVIDTPSHDLNADLRLLVDGRRNKLSWQADYQFLVRSGDTLELSALADDSFAFPNAVPDDERRLLDLTHIIAENDDRVVAHRLDRLHLGYTGDKTVLRLGRQAVSWGNGLIYNPVDFFNPFDPAAIDKEYKTGDDMLYGQYLQDNGNDAQFVSVWRRNEDGDIDSGVNTQALKYHGFVGERELDLLVARHYKDEIVSAGGVSAWGGAIVRGDVLWTHTDADDYVSAVVNLSYSWVFAGKNMSGVTEYFYNDLGLREDDYDQLAISPDLLERLKRGELFTLGRHYLAGGLSIEMTPLLLVSPNVFLNLGDGSGLAQVVGRYDFRQDWQLLLALSLPFGSAGTEFGGLDTPVPDKQFSSGPGLFAQLAFSFFDPTVGIICLTERR